MKFVFVCYVRWVWFGWSLKTCTHTLTFLFSLSIISRLFFNIIFGPNGPLKRLVSWFCDDGYVKVSIFFFSLVFSRERKDKIEEKDECCVAVVASTLFLGHWVFCWFFNLDYDGNRFKLPFYPFLKDSSLFGFWSLLYCRRSNGQGVMKVF